MIAAGHLAPRAIDIETRDGHGRDRINKLRIQNAQQGLRDLWKFGIDILLNASGQKRETLNQALNMGVSGFRATKFQSTGNLGIGLSKGIAHAAQISQFPLIMP